MSDDVNIPEVIATIIEEKCRAGCAALQGGMVMRYGQDHALVLPSGWVYLIAVRPGRIAVNPPEDQPAASGRGA